MPKLIGDVKAVVDHFGGKPAVIVGHDWGGAIAWSFAMRHPDLTDRLIILNLPHPAALARELANNPDQRKASAYARRFQEPRRGLEAERPGPHLLGHRSRGEAKYSEAFKKSSFEAMLNYYKANLSQGTRIKSRPRSPRSSVRC